MKVGILGGTGLDDPDILQIRNEVVYDKTAVKPAANGQPADYGVPSDNLITGTFMQQCLVLCVCIQTEKIICGEVAHNCLHDCKPPSKRILALFCM